MFPKIGKALKLIVDIINNMNQINLINNHNNSHKISINNNNINKISNCKNNKLKIKINVILLVLTGLNNNYYHDKNREILEIMYKDI